MEEPLRRFGIAEEETTEDDSGCLADWAGCWRVVVAVVWLVVGESSDAERAGRGEL